MDAAKSNYAVLTLMLVMSGAVQAQSVGDLATIQAETLMLRARAAKAEAQSLLDQASNKGAATSVTGTDDSPVLPVVRGVYGSGRLVAKLLFADGSTLEAGKGDLIPGGFSVREVSMDRVELARQGKAFPLGFSQMKPVAPAKPATPQLPMAPISYSMPAPSLGSGK